MHPTDAEIAAYQRDGVVVLREVLTPDEVGGLRRAADQVAAAPGPLAVRVADDPETGRFVEDFRRRHDMEAIDRIACTSGLPEAVAALMGSGTVRLNHDHVLVREHGTARRTPWHQDQPYYDLDGHQTVSCWLSLDPVAADESLQVVAGTHLGPWLMPRTFREGEAKWFPEGTLADLPDIDGALAEDPAAFDVRSYAVEPGDAVCFHFLSVHGAPGTSAGRRVVSLRYVGDDVVRAARPWRTSPPFPELEGVLDDGAPLVHPLFPVVWPEEPPPGGGGVPWKAAATP